MDDQAFDELPDGWTVWSDEPDGRAVLAFRPDVFDSEAFPPACLPTLYLTRGRRNARRPGPARETATDWFVTLYLEPEINYPEQRYSTRDAAVEGVLKLAERFAAGEIDYREFYQVPREDYFRALDDLTGPSRS